MRLTSTRRALASPRGFTMIELLIVMTILVILAGIGLARYATAVQRTGEAALKEDLFRMRSALDEYYADKGKYPASLEALVEDEYLRAIPVDPFTNSADTWETEYAEPDAGNPSAEIGIANVKSGSDRTAIDNSRYSGW